MIGQGILGQIANPQMADIAGALDVREARLQRDEQRRKEIRMGQLIAEAVPNLREGSPLHQMALENPSAFMQFTKAAGIPMNNGEALQEFANDTTMLYQMAQQDPKDAYEWAVSQAEQRRKAGREPMQLDKFIAGMEDDPARTITGLLLTANRIVGQQEMTAGEREFAALTEGLSPEEADKARRIKLGLDARAVGSSDVTIATEGLTDVVADSKGRIAGTVEGDKKTAAGNVTRLQDFANRGVTAAEAMPTLKRSLEVLDLVRTGGMNAAVLRAKQMFGVEGADEAELSANLGKAVLSQLKETFGAQFTEKEGERLERIEAGFGKSVAGNRRLLEQTLKIVETKAKRGYDSAIELGDDFTAQDIQNYMSQTLDDSPYSQGAQQQGGAAPALSGQDQQAYEWAKANPNDPRAAAILQKLGVR